MGSTRRGGHGRTSSSRVSASGAGTWASTVSVSSSRIGPCAVNGWADSPLPATLSRLVDNKPTDDSAAVSNSKLVEEMEAWLEGSASSRINKSSVFLSVGAGESPAEELGGGACGGVGLEVRKRGRRPLGRPSPEFSLSSPSPSSDSESKLPSRESMSLSSGAMGSWRRRRFQAPAPIPEAGRVAPRVLAGFHDIPAFDPREQGLSNVIWCFLWVPVPSGPAGSLPGSASCGRASSCEGSSPRFSPPTRPTKAEVLFRSGWRMGPRWQRASASSFEPIPRS